MYASKLRRMPQVGDVFMVTVHTSDGPRLMKVRVHSEIFSLINYVGAYFYCSLFSPNGETIDGGISVHVVAGERDEFLATTY